MKKLTLLGISNWAEKGRFRTELRIKKQQVFFKHFKNLLINLGWDKWDLCALGEDENHKAIKLFNYLDTSENYYNKGYDIDVIYFSKRIELIVRGNNSKREKFIKELDKISKWIKPKPKKRKKRK